MKVLFIGDIFGRPGRNFLKEKLASIAQGCLADFVIANIENAAGGRGITKKVADELFCLPIDAGTGGNHIWEQSGSDKLLEEYPIARPMNIKGDLPGKGIIILEKKGMRLAVASLIGSVYMDEKGPEKTNAFLKADEILSGKNMPKNILIDFHAEATSEKRALLWYLNGRVSAMLGTHTHVQTSDEEVTDEGTAYITDVGMTGPHKSVIGMKPKGAIERFLTGKKRSLVVASEGVRLEAVLLDISDDGLATSIKRIQIKGDA